MRPSELAMTRAGHLAAAVVQLHDVDRGAGCAHLDDALLEAGVVGFAAAAEPAASSSASAAASR
jgi:hypothetical protein